MPTAVPMQVVVRAWLARLARCAAEIPRFMMGAGMNRKLCLEGRWKRVRSVHASSSFNGAEALTLSRKCQAGRGARRAVSAVDHGCTVGLQERPYWHFSYAQWQLMLLIVIRFSCTESTTPDQPLAMYYICSLHSASHHNSHFLRACPPIQRPPCSSQLMSDHTELIVNELPILDFVTAQALVEQ